MSTSTKVKSGYEISELVGRKAFTELMGEFHPERVNLIKHTNYEFESFDTHMVIKSKGKELNVLVEIKTRNKTFSDYILEEKKQKGMIRYCKENKLKNVVLLYVNFCPEGTYIWNITNVSKYNKKTIYCNRNTVRSTYDKVSKTVYKVKPTDGTSYKYIIDLKRLTKELN